MKDKLKDLQIWWSECAWAPCVLRYEAIYPYYPSPVGIVWVYRTGNRPRKKLITQANVLFSWTNPIYLRRGVRTAIQKQILKDCDQIVTGGAASKAANAFMKKQGYKLSKDMNSWFLNKPKKGIK